MFSPAATVVALHGRAECSPWGQSPPRGALPSAAQASFFVCLATTAYSVLRAQELAASWAKRMAPKRKWGADRKGAEEEDSVEETSEDENEKPAKASPKKRAKASKKKKAKVGKAKAKGKATTTKSTAENAVKATKTKKAVASKAKAKGKKGAAEAASPGSEKWHQTELVVAKPEKEPRTHNEDVPEVGDADDGATTTRAQRYVFESHMDQLPQEIVDRYMQLKDPKHKEAGKIRERSKIINAYVKRDADYKDKLTPQPKQIEVITRRRVTRDDLTEIIGLPETLCIGKNFGGNRDLFNEAKQKGHVQQNEKGLWIYRAEKAVISDSQSKDVSGLAKYEAKDDVTFRAALANHMDSVGSLSANWLAIAATATKALQNPTSTALACDTEAADRGDMKILQESFDAVTQVTSAIRRVALELCSLNSSVASSELARNGVQLCKQVIPSQNEVEELLLSPMATLTKNQIRSALVKAAGPYRDLITYYNELVAIHKHHQVQLSKSGSSSSAGVKFKNLEL